MLNIDKVYLICGYTDLRKKAESLSLIIDNFIEYVEWEIKDAFPRILLGKALDYAERFIRIEKCTHV